MDAELVRRHALLDAQHKAAQLFEETAATLIRPGVSESQLTREIGDLAQRRFGVTRNWHKRIVRAGANTLLPYDDNPDDLVIGADDIVFLDFGPVFEEWEADFGRTYVLGNDPAKLTLRDDVASAFAQGKRWFESHPQATGSELFRHAQQLAASYGWEYGGTIAGHLVGEFPHKEIQDRATAYAHADNHAPMRGLDVLGREKHWILEIHFVDRARRIGGFYEELLTV